MSHIFLSDVHFGAFDRETNANIESDLIALIDYCEERGIRIHLLGDLFDYWMEYPDWVPPHGKKILKRFADYHHIAGPSLYITGNHDNWNYGHFETAGFDVEADYRLEIIDDKLVFLHHGDGLSYPEFGLRRPILHRLLRHKQFVRLFQFLFPPAAGIALMKYFSRFSRWNTTVRPERLSNWSRQFLEKSRVDLVLSGHDHLPRVETFDFGSYINLGNFCYRRSLVRYTNNRFELVIWDGINRQLALYDQHSSIDFA